MATPYARVPEAGSATYAENGGGMLGAPGNMPHARLEESARALLGREMLAEQAGA